MAALQMGANALHGYFSSRDLARFARKEEERQKKNALISALSKGMVPGTQSVGFPGPSTATQLSGLAAQGLGAYGAYRGAIQANEMYESDKARRALETSALERAAGRDIGSDAWHARAQAAQDEFSGMPGGVAAFVREGGADTSGMLSRPPVDPVWGDAMTPAGGAIPPISPASSQFANLQQPGIFQDSTAITPEGLTDPSQRAGFFGAEAASRALAEEQRNARRALDIKEQDLAADVARRGEIDARRLVELEDRRLRERAAEFTRILDSELPKMYGMKRLLEARPNFLALTGLIDSVQQSLAQAEADGRELTAEEQAAFLSSFRQIAIANLTQRFVDPATVREGDIALQREAAQTWWQRAKLTYNNILSPDKPQIFDKAIIQDMRRMADVMYAEFSRGAVNELDAYMNSQSVSGFQSVLRLEDLPALKEAAYMRYQLPTPAERAALFTPEGQEDTLAVSGTEGVTAAIGAADTGVSPEAAKLDLLEEALTVPVRGAYFPTPIPTPTPVQPSLDTYRSRFDAEGPSATQGAFTIEGGDSGVGVPRTPVPSLLQHQESPYRAENIYPKLLELWERKQREASQSFQGRRAQTDRWGVAR